MKHSVMVYIYIYIYAVAYLKKQDKTKIKTVRKEEKTQNTIQTRIKKFIVKAMTSGKHKKAVYQMFQFKVFNGGIQ